MRAAGAGTLKPHTVAPARLQCRLRPSPRPARLCAQACIRRSSAGSSAGPPVKVVLQRMGQAALGAAAAGCLALGAPAAAEEVFMSFPISANPAVFEVQRTLVEAWNITTEVFVDPQFNDTDWVNELVASLTTAADATTPEDAQKQIKDMLGKLGDPFTRWVPPREYEDFRVGSDGELQGVGLLIAADPSSGRLVVLTPIKGSPADRAGILPGDEVVSVDGASTKGWDNEMAARHLRGSEGSAVWVEVARHGGSDEIPGMAGERFTDPEAERKRFRLRREKLEFSPVFATPMHFDGHTYGYVRLVNFSQKAEVEMRKAIAQLQRDGAEGYILDLRNNPGGLVSSSLDIAGLWMDGAAHPTIFNIEDREGSEEKLAKVQLDSGRAATDLPLVVLVNKQSASASEILAAALHDNHRATLLGEPTFGKGKIQSVFELSDGSALFVTVAKYKTPSGSDIDKVGVQPDRACSRLEGKVTIPGIPVGPGASDKVIEELASDDCVLSAQSFLEAHTEGGAWKPFKMASAPGLRLGA